MRGTLSWYAVILHTVISCFFLLESGTYASSIWNFEELIIMFITQFLELLDVKLCMLGSHQLQNAATATCAALCLRNLGEFLYVCYSLLYLDSKTMDLPLIFKVKKYLWGFLFPLQFRIWFIYAYLRLILGFGLKP